MRHYGSLSRIELGKEEISKFNNNRLREKVITAFKKLGFVYVTLDLEGYRAGSMNEILYRRYPIRHKYPIGYKYAV